MLGRYEEELEGTPLPQDWQEGFIAVLNEAYHDRSEQDQRFFDVYGSVYEQEFLVIVSYVHKSDQLASPITIFISHDIIEDQKHMKKALKNVADFAGSILDDIFSIEDWDEYCLTWTDSEFGGNTFYYKITRENISLTLQANELLKGNLPQ